MDADTDVVLAAVACLNAHDATALQAHFDPGIVERFPALTCHGPQAVAAYFQSVFDALPDFRLEPVATAAQGDAVFLRWTMTGTHTGAPYMGIAPTGRAIRLEGMDHFTLAGGRIVSNVVVFDQLDFARQIGLLPADASPVDRVLKAGFNGLTAARRAVAARRR